MNRKEQFSLRTVVCAQYTLTHSWWEENLSARSCNFFIIVQDYIINVISFGKFNFYSRDKFNNTVGHTFFSPKLFQGNKELDWQHCNLILLYDTVAGEVFIYSYWLFLCHSFLYGILPYINWISFKGNRKKVCQYCFLSEKEMEKRET